MVDSAEFEIEESSEIDESRSDFDIFAAMAAKLGAVRTLAKPFGRRELLEAVAAALEDPGTSSPKT